MIETKSVLPDWLIGLTYQQQSVAILGLRGPDGIRKFHPCKAVCRAYRGTLLVAAKYGRLLHWGEVADNFMSLDRFADPELWTADVKSFFETVDELPAHFSDHLAHAAQVVSLHHPEERFRIRWEYFYAQYADSKHLNPETAAQIEQRLSDWNQEFWGE